MGTPRRVPGPAPLRLLAGATAVVALVVGSVVPVSAAPTATTETYVQTVCAAIASVSARIEPLGPAFEQAADTFTSDPTQVNAGRLRDAFVAILEASRLDGAIAAMKAAGVPEVEGGKRFAKAVVRHTRDADRRMRALIARVKSMDLTSAQGFVREFEGVQQSLQATAKDTLRATRRDPAFKNQPAALSPLVVFMTTEAPACPSANA